jgi:uncharacterized protein (DUF433 family)
MTDNVHRLYGDADPRYLAAYGIPEAARYLRIPRSTLRAWVRGQRAFKPVIALPDRKAAELSFINLVEAHVLDALRRQHQISMQKVRKSLSYIEQELGSKHPLATETFQTDGLDLFVERYARLVSTSQQGQLAMKEILKEHLKRVEFEKGGFALRLFPFTRKTGLTDPKVVVIDPLRAFGRPVLGATGIPTAVISERFHAGDSLIELSKDYGRDPAEIEEAIRCEQLAA